MAATIDKGSITAKKTDDPLVFNIGFDFTDDAIDPAQGWLNKWLHASFVYNTNMTGTQFNASATAAMARARKSTAESTLETTLKANFGTAIVRENPTISLPNDGQDSLHPLFVKVVTL